MKRPSTNLTPEQFERLARLIHDRCGFALRAEQQPALERQVAERMAATGTAELERYLVTVASPMSSSDEFHALVDGVLVQETFFFRTPAHFEALQKSVLPRLLDRSGMKKSARPLAVWSAGCATGPEAYSLAIALLESCVGENFSLLATDISPSALAEAREGRYAGRALKTVSPQRLSRWFVPDGDGFRVRDEVRSRVRFQLHNLAADAFPSGIDLVLCRNVLIYFPAAVRSRIVARFHASLTEGGAIFVGHSETLSDHPELFERVWLDRTFGFLRRAPLPPVAPAAPSAPVAKVVAPARRRPTGKHRVPSGAVPAPWRPIGVGPKTPPSGSPLPIEVIALDGPLDDATAEDRTARLRDRLAGILERTAPRVVFDLTDVTMMDASGLHLLRRAMRLVADHGGRSCCVCANAAVRRWLEREGAPADFECVETLPQARQALGE